MKRFLAFAVLAIAFASGVYAVRGVTGNKGKTELRPVGNFTQIVINSPVYVYYTQGKKAEVKVEGPADKLQYVLVEVNSNKLVVSCKNKSKRGFGGLSFSNSVDMDGVKVYVTSPDLIGVQLLGSGDFDCRGKLDTDNMRIELRGSGDISFENIICDNIYTELVGSGDISLNSVDALKSTVSLVGSGDITISQKNVKATTATLKGSGDISIKFSKCGTADCSLMGSGDFELSGTLRQLNKKQLGSGDFDTDGLRTGK